MQNYVFSTFLGQPIWLPRAMSPNFFDFLTPLGIFLGAYFRNWPNFHFWAFWKESKMPKITKLTIKIKFFNILRQPIWLPRARLKNFFDFLTPLEIFLIMYFRNWPNCHFWGFWKKSKIPKITKMTIKITFFWHF